mmetsp:Transcript_56524/g.115127  ORF Transcript_56524/g.115127 Transcript_56524/m.115127 type:complete len:220 (-) Transcript_56524:45-704(-)
MMAMHCCLRRSDVRTTCIVRQFAVASSTEYRESSLLSPRASVPGSLVAFWEGMAFLSEYSTMTRSLAHPSLSIGTPVSKTLAKSSRSTNSIPEANCPVCRPMKESLKWGFWFGLGLLFSRSFLSCCSCCIIRSFCSVSFCSRRICFRESSSVSMAFILRSVVSVAVLLLLWLVWTAGGHGSLSFRPTRNNNCDCRWASSAVVPTVVEATRMFHPKENPI